MNFFDLQFPTRNANLIAKINNFANFQAAINDVLINYCRVQTLKNVVRLINRVIPGSNDDTNMSRLVFGLKSLNSENFAGLAYLDAS